MDQKKWLQVNDCVSVSVSDPRWWSDTYEGMIINLGELITVLFTDGDVYKYEHTRNSITPLNVEKSLSVTEKILKVLEHKEEQNTKLEQQKAHLEQQKAKVNEKLSQLFI